MSPTVRYFVVRPDTRQSADGKIHPVPGPIVPLIAVDELPGWLDITGVPRELSVEQTIGLCNLGTASKANGTYAIRIIHPNAPTGHKQSARAQGSEIKGQNGVTASAAQVSSQPPAAQSTETNVSVHGPATSATAHPADRMRVHWSEPLASSQTQNRGGITNSVHNPQQSGQRQSHQPTPAQHLHPGHSNPPSASPASTSAIKTGTTTTLPTNTNTNPAPNTNTTLTTTTPAPGNTPSTSTNTSTPTPGDGSLARTEYCRHWCHHGTCKWGLACRYLHAMPTSPAELAGVGLRDIPAWWVATVAGQPLHRKVHVHGGGHRAVGNLGGVGGMGVGGLSGMSGVAAGMTASGPGPGPGPDSGVAGVATAAAGTAAGGTPGFDPRDVRAGIVPRLGTPLLSTAPTPTQGGPVSEAASKSAVKAQLRETVALLRELGVSVGYGNGNGRGKRRERGITPLDKGRGARGVEKEALLRAAKAEMAARAGAAAAAAGSGAVAGGGGGAGDDAAQGQGQAVVAGPALEKAAEGTKEQGGQRTGTGGPAAAAQQVGKLVDV